MHACRPHGEPCCWPLGRNRSVGGESSKRCRACMPHVGLPGQLAPGVAGQVVGLEGLAAALQLARHAALGRALRRPGARRQHLRAHAAGMLKALQRKSISDHHRVSSSHRHPSTLSIVCYMIVVRFDKDIRVRMDTAGGCSSGGPGMRSRHTCTERSISEASSDVDVPCCLCRSALYSCSAHHFIMPMAAHLICSTQQPLLAPASYPTCTDPHAGAGFVRKGMQNGVHSQLQVLRTLF
jgi:hypothetical protein